MSTGRKMGEHISSSLFRETAWTKYYAWKTIVTNGKIIHSRKLEQNNMEVKKTDSGIGGFEFIS